MSLSSFQISEQEISFDQSNSGSEVGEEDEAAVQRLQGIHTSGERRCSKPSVKLELDSTAQNRSGESPAPKLNPDTQLTHLI
jgi:hypothetical protein